MFSIHNREFKKALKVLKTVTGTKLEKYPKPVFDYAVLDEDYITYVHKRLTIKIPINVIKDYSVKGEVIFPVKDAIYIADMLDEKGAILVGANGIKQGEINYTYAKSIRPDQYSLDITAYTDRNEPVATWETRGVTLNKEKVLRAMEFGEIFCSTSNINVQGAPNLCLAYNKATNVVELVGTDECALSLGAAPIEESFFKEEFKFVFMVKHPAILKKLLKLLPDRKLILYYSEDKLRFIFPESEVVLQLKAAHNDFYNYRDYITKGKTHCTVRAAEIKSTLERVVKIGAVPNNKYNPIKNKAVKEAMCYINKELTLLVADRGMGEISTPIEAEVIEKIEKEVAFNPNYLLKLVKAAKKLPINISFRGAECPIDFTVGEHRAIVMALRQ